MQALTDFLLKWRLVLALLSIISAAAVTWGITFNRIDSTYNAVLSENDPYRVEVEQAQEDFPPSTSVVYLFEADPDVLNLPALRAMEDLGARFTEVESAISLGSLLNYRLDDADADRLDRDYLIPPLDQLTPEILDELRDIALSDEELTESRLAPSGDLALAVLKYKALDDEQSTRLSIAESVIDLRDSLKKDHPEVRIYVLGRVLFERDGYNATIKDRNYLFPITIILSIVLLWATLRSLTYSLSLMVVAFATIGVTLGTYGWLDIAFNQISSLGPLVVLVIAIADGIHIVSVYVQGLHRGLSKLDAMRDSLLINIQPVSLATITTAIGFLCLNYSSSPGIYGFGNIVAIGVVWAFVFTLALLPAIILLLPTAKTAKPLGVKPFIDWVDRSVKERGNQLFWGGALIIAITLGLLPLNKMDFNRFSFVDKDSDFHHAMTAMSEKIGNDQSLAFSIDSGSYYGITEPEFLDQVDRFSQWLEEQPETSFVASYTDYLRARNKSEHDDDEAYDRVPSDKLQIIDYLVGYQLVQEIEPSLEPIFNGEYSAVRLVIGTSNLSNLQLVQFNERIDAWIEHNITGDYQVLHGDYSILFARLDHTITVELVQGFSLSFLLITLTMLVGLQSVRYGLLSTMPNLFPATIVFGCWGLFVGELSPYILMLFSISIGLVVDDSVHILSKYITARRRGEAPEPAVSYSLDKAGSAITITTLSLAIGTIILVFSNTFHFQNVALLLTPIILVAWLLDLLFLPPLLIRFDNWWENRGRQSSVAADHGG